MTDLKTYPYDTAEFLDSEELVAAYLDEALASGDARIIAEAIGTVARARGMTQVAKGAGVSRENLYRALSADGNPELATVLRVITALGLRLTVTPNDTSSQKS